MASSPSTGVSGTSEPASHTHVEGLRLRLSPNNAQQGALLASAGAARFTWNWAVAQIKANQNIYRAQTLENLPKEARTRPLSFLDLQKRWYVQRDQVAEWHEVPPASWERLIPDVESVIRLAAVQGIDCAEACFSEGKLEPTRVGAFLSARHGRSLRNDFEALAVAAGAKVVSSDNVVPELDLPDGAREAGRRVASILHNEDLSAPAEVLVRATRATSVDGRVEATKLYSEVIGFGEVEEACQVSGRMEASSGFSSLEEYRKDLSDRVASFAASAVNEPLERFLESLPERSPGFAPLVCDFDQLRSSPEERAEWADILADHLHPEWSLRWDSFQDAMKTYVKSPEDVSYYRDMFIDMNRPIPQALKAILGNGTDEDRVRASVKFSTVWIAVLHSPKGVLEALVKMWQAERSARDEKSAAELPERPMDEDEVNSEDPKSETEHQVVVDEPEEEAEANTSQGRFRRYWPGGTKR